MIRSTFGDAVTRPESCISRGSQIGAGPDNQALTLIPDHLMGADQYALTLC